MIGSAEMFLGPTHDVGPLAGSSTCSKCSSPRGCVAGAEALG